VRSWVLRRGFVATIAALNRAGLGPLGADVSRSELRRAGLRAFGEVLARLDVPAPHVVFGHTHRAGPRPDDDPAEWRTPGGARLWNTGTWCYEDHFLDGSPVGNPYWPGAGILLGDDGDPEVVRFLGERLEPAGVAITPPRV
jgi:hypothetical protein